jgi:hypothetical protein
MIPTITKIANGRGTSEPIPILSVVGTIPKDATNAIFITGHSLVNAP